MNDQDNGLNWREADMVELHDANVALYRRGYPEGAVGWTELGFGGAEYHVKGIPYLLEAIGVPGPYAYTKNRKRYRLSDWSGLSVHRLPSEVGYSSREGHRIEKLEAAIEGELLHLRTCCWYEQDGEERYYSQQVTYRGSFSVWWTHDLDDCDPVVSLRDDSGE